jgi:hypothetical protein
MDIKPQEAFITTNDTALSHGIPLGDQENFLRAMKLLKLNFTTCITYMIL